MVNQLKVAKVLSIQALHAQGWSQRRIARELGIHRETVARHLGQASKPAKAPIGSADGEVDSKPAKAPPGSGDGEALSKPATASSCRPMAFCPAQNCRPAAANCVYTTDASVIDRFRPPRACTCARRYLFRSARACCW